MATKAAATVLPSTIIQKTDKVQLRIGVSEYKGVKSLGLREWVKDSKGVWIPTKAGTNISNELLPEVLVAMQKHGSTLPQKVIDLSVGRFTKYIVAASVEDVVFHKDKFEDSEEAAKSGDIRGQAPNGYKLFKVLIVDGVIVKQACLYTRYDGKWIVAVAATKKPAVSGNKSLTRKV